MVISLKGGEMWGLLTIQKRAWVTLGGLFLHWRLLFCSYVLTLITDGMRSVRAFHFDKAAASVLTTCVSVLPSAGVHVSLELSRGMSMLSANRKVCSRLFTLLGWLLWLFSRSELSWDEFWWTDASSRWWPWSPDTCSWALAWETLCSSSTLKSFRRCHWRKARTDRKRKKTRTRINKYVQDLVVSVVCHYAGLILGAYAFQEEPPSKKKRVESSINWTGMVWFHSWDASASHSTSAHLQHYSFQTRLMRSRCMEVRPSRAPSWPPTHLR